MMANVANIVRRANALNHEYLYRWGSIKRRERLVCTLNDVSLESFFLLTHPKRLNRRSTAVIRSAVDIHSLYINEGDRMAARQTHALSPLSKFTTISNDFLSYYYKPASSVNGHLPQIVLVSGYNSTIETGLKSNYLAKLAEDCGFGFLVCCMELYATPSCTRPSCTRLATRGHSCVGKASSRQHHSLLA